MLSLTLCKSFECRLNKKEKCPNWFRISRKNFKLQFVWFFFVRYHEGVFLTLTEGLGVHSGYSKIPETREHLLKPFVTGTPLQVLPTEKRVPWYENALPLSLFFSYLFCLCLCLSLYLSLFIYIYIYIYIYI